MDEGIHIKSKKYFFASVDLNPYEQNFILLLSTYEVYPNLIDPLIGIKFCMLEVSMFKTISVLTSHKGLEATLLYACY